jgi:hypothetical protein
MLYRKHKELKKCIGRKEFVGCAIFHEHEFSCKPRDGAVIGENVH